MDKLRSSVRPVITFSLVAAQVGLAVAWVWVGEAAEKPFAALAPFTMMALQNWFGSRAKK